MPSTASRQNWRKLKAGWRDTRILLGQFRRPLNIFIILMVGCGALYDRLSQFTATPTSSFIEGVYDVLTLVFLQPIEPFPDEWYLQLFYFILPVAGIGLLALGLAEFGILFFNRSARGKDWQMAVASTLSKHTIVVGLGHLGYRVVLHLHDLGHDVVVIELSAKPHIWDHLQKLGIPILEDDATRPDILLAAGVRQAQTIILCTQNDSLNLEVALKARNLNPSIRVVIRIFDNDFAESLQKQFGFYAFSATGMAAPLFAAAATNIDLTPPILIEGQPHILARLEVSEFSNLAGLSVSELEEKYHTSLIYLAQDGKTMFHPEGSISVHKGASLALFGTPANINLVLNENRS
uniref:RCK N-terminal domain-containing protein n=1 Tax=Anaerolinea thermolimosa TaxID=229919 RepID=A0A7C4PGI4_9CHLR